VSDENEDIIPWYLRVAFAPLMLISNVGDKISYWKATRADKKARKGK